MTLECEHREISSLYSHVFTKISLTHQNMMLTINFLHYKQQVPGQLRSPQSNDEDMTMCCQVRAIANLVGGTYGFGALMECLLSWESEATQRES